MTDTKPGTRRRWLLTQNRQLRQEGILTPAG